MLAVNWFRHTTGVLRVSLIWLSLYVIGNLGLRVFIQIQNFNDEIYETWLTPIRLLLNATILALGVYLAKNSGRINREGEFS